MRLVPLLRAHHQVEGLLEVEVLSLIDHVLRTQLAKTGEKLSGLYAGNPKQAIERPTTEAVLRAFKDIFLNLACIGESGIPISRHCPNCKIGFWIC